MKNGILDKQYFYFIMTIENIKERIIPLLKKYSIKRAGIFGSYANGMETDVSDIDVLVELGPEIGLLKFVEIKLDMEDILNRKVDLVEYKALKPRLKDRILSEERRIYG